MTGQRRREWPSFEPTNIMNSRDLYDATFHKKNNICNYRADMPPNGLSIGPTKCFICPKCLIYIPKLCVPNVPKSQMAHVSQISHVSQMTHMSNVFQMAHVCQMLHVSQISHVSQMSQVSKKTKPYRLWCKIFLQWEI